MIRVENEGNIQSEEQEKLNKSLIKAAESGDMDSLRLAYQKGANIDAQDEAGCTALMKASENGYLEEVELLIDWGARIDAEDNNSETALDKAYANEWDEIAKILIMAFVTVYSEEIKEAGSELKEYLGLSDDPPPQHPLVRAARNGRLDKVRQFLNKGYRVNAKDPTSGKTALMEASQKGHLKIVELLLDKGGNVNAQHHETGHTALTLAMKNMHAQTAKTLIAAGADTDLENRLQ